MIRGLNHALGRRVHSHKDAHRGSLRLDRAEQVADVPGVCCAALDRYQRPVAVAFGVNREPDHSVDSTVTDLLLIRLTVEHHDAPALELERRTLEQRLRTGQVARDSKHVVRLLNFLAIGMPQPRVDEVDSERRHVDAYPSTPELLCCIDSRPATTERVKHNIARIARCLDDSL